jgi:hypothetical protein
MVYQKVLTGDLCECIFTASEHGMNGTIVMVGQEGRESIGLELFAIGGKELWHGLSWLGMLRIVALHSQVPGSRLQWGIQCFYFNQLI